MRVRAAHQATNAPLSIYELHAGSWQCELDESGEVARYYNWRELAERLVPYIQELGFTPGATVRLVAKAAFGGAMAFQVRGSTIALRRADAACVEI